MDVSSHRSGCPESAQVITDERRSATNARTNAPESRHTQGYPFSPISPEIRQREVEEDDAGAR